MQQDLRYSSRPDQVQQYPFASKGIRSEVKVVDETISGSLMQELATLSQLDQQRNERQDFDQNSATVVKTINSASFIQVQADSQVLATNSQEIDIMDSKEKNETVVKSEDGFSTATGEEKSMADLS